MEENDFSLSYLKKSDKIITHLESSEESDHS
jgi:hypothetical protein